MNIADQLVYIVVHDDKHRVKTEIFSSMAKAMNYYYQLLKKECGEQLEGLRDAPFLESLQIRQEKYWPGLCNHTYYDAEFRCVFIEEAYVDNVY